MGEGDCWLSGCILIVVWVKICNLNLRDGTLMELVHRLELTVAEKAMDEGDDTDIIGIFYLYCL